MEQTAKVSIATDPTVDPLEGTKVLAAYRARSRRSAALAEEARSALPSGIAHDSRHMHPHGIYVDRAQGPMKWDVDGNGYVDFFGGHGALILGHGDPDVRRAIDVALDRGTQFAAGHADEIAWARRIIDLVPSAERVRFTSSGTEATLMAVRLARAFTGRDLVLRFPGHYHGWQDDMTTGYQSHFDGSAPSGVPGPVAAATILADPLDPVGLSTLFDRYGRDLAAVIFEPLGAATGQIPLSPDAVGDLRRLTERSGTILIFDEVITGFRVAPGGVQADIGITPDLSSFAKIVAGGLPGGAVAGRKDILDGLDFERAAAAGREKIYHPGTFNANPVSAAAGIACLDKLSDGTRIAALNAASDRFRASLNEVLASERVPWAVYGRASAFHIYLNPDNHPIDPTRFDPDQVDARNLKTKPPRIARALRLAMLVNGVDLAGWPGGLLSTTHALAVLTEASEAFGESLRLLKSDGLITVGERR